MCIWHPIWHDGHPTVFGDYEECHSEDCNTSIDFVPMLTHEERMAVIENYIPGDPSSLAARANLAAHQAYLNQPRGRGGPRRYGGSESSQALACRQEVKLPALAKIEPVPEGKKGKGKGKEEEEEEEKKKKKKEGEGVGAQKKDVNREGRKKRAFKSSK